MTTHAAPLLPFLSLVLLEDLPVACGGDDGAVNGTSSTTLRANQDDTPGITDGTFDVLHE
ncbi:MAG: hypothetical protein ACQEXJ_15865 [Myxococcota bacterium]